MSFSSNTIPTFFWFAVMSANFGTITISIVLSILLGKIFYLNGRIVAVVEICFSVISFIIIINRSHYSHIKYVNEKFSLDGYFPKNTCLSNEV